MIVGLLLLVSVLLIWPVPTLLSRQRAPRRAPGAALVLWQAVAVSAMFGGLSVAPLVVLQFVRRGREIPSPGSNLGLLVTGLAVSGVLLARLLLQGHRVGRRLRRLRREHRDLVDLIGTAPSTVVRVVEHPTPTAYCIPGLRPRVVLAAGTLATLPRDELAALLLHERAHLAQRHDLIIEFFTVLHTAVPAPVRSVAALDEVKLLIELLADRLAARAAGAVPLARALFALAGGEHPDAALGAAGSGGLVRLELLGDPRPAVLPAVIALVAAGVVVAVVGLLAWGAVLGLA